MPEGVQVQSVMFYDGRVEVSFIEERHVTKTGVRIQTLQEATSSVEDEFADVVEAVKALIDAIELYHRNPPVRIPARSTDG